MAKRTTYTVQAFRTKGRGLEAEPPQQAHDEQHAMRKAERIAVGKAGAVAIRQDSDAAAGDYDDPVVLRVIGQVPEIFLGHLPF